MKVLSLLLVLFLSSSCIKDDRVVAPTTNEGSGTTTSGSDDGSSTPTADPLASEAWHLENTGQFSFSTSHGISGEDMSLKAAIDRFEVTGKNIRVAISDSGTDAAHSDLKDNQLSGEHRNYALSSATYWHNTSASNLGDAHGTAVTGLLAAKGWNGIGSRGIAPDAKYAAFLFVGGFMSRFSTSSVLARTIDQTDGNFDIFNYSYGYSDCVFVDEDPLVNEAILDGVTNLRSGKGAIYVQSAGNGFTGDLAKCLGPSYSGSYAANTNSSSDLASPHKIIVGAVNSRGVKSSYSTAGSGIWVTAPGGEANGATEPAMITTDLSGCTDGYSKFSSTLNSFNKGTSALNTKCDYTSLMNGTSSAAPVLSGVVALMLEANPNLSWRDVKHILALTADTPEYSTTQDLYHPLGLDMSGYTYDMLWRENAAGISFSNWYGFGRANAFRALLMASNYTYPLGTYERTVNPADESWYYDSGTINVAVPDADPVGNTSTIKVSHNFFVEAIQIQLTTNHTFPTDLAVHLISPNRSESILLNINSNLNSFSLPANKLLLTNAFYGEESLGDWTIKLVDGYPGDTGTLTNWKILIHGHKIAGDGSYPTAVTNVSHQTTYYSKTVGPPVTFTGSTSTDVIRYEVSVGSSPGASNKLAWTSIGLATNFQLRNLDLTNNAYHYLNIRAIDERENTSSVRTTSWYVSY